MLPITPPGIIYYLFFFKQAEQKIISWKHHVIELDCIVEPYVQAARQLASKAILSKFLIK
jgi:hypothetical protein